MYGPFSAEILARIEARMGEPDRAVAALSELLSIPYRGPLVWVRPITPAMLQLTRCLIRCGVIRVFRSSSQRKRLRLRKAQSDEQQRFVLH